jgi:hypothetical protein
MYANAVIQQHDTDGRLWPISGLPVSSPDTTDIKILDDKDRLHKIPDTLTRAQNWTGLRNLHYPALECK